MTSPSLPFCCNYFIGILIAPRDNLVLLTATMFSSICLISCFKKPIFDEIPSTLYFCRNVWKLYFWCLSLLKLFSYCRIIKFLFSFLKVPRWTCLPLFTKLNHKQVACTVMFSSLSVAWVYWMFVSWDLQRMYLIFVWFHSVKCAVDLLVFLCEKVCFKQVKLQDCWLHKKMQYV